MGSFYTRYENPDSILLSQQEQIMISCPSQWLLPPDTMKLGEVEVHVWRAPLDLHPEHLENLGRILTPGEMERAKRFFFQNDRQKFVAARGLLRSILAHYLEKQPDKLRFSYSPYGKPSLASDFGELGLRFNMSHSHEMTLIAITRGRDIGLDIERIRPNLAYQQISRRFFSPGEVANLIALPSHLQQEAFFTCWTRKEAYIKARGEGLSYPLDQFEVSLAPGEPAALLMTRGNPHEASRWSIFNLDPGPGYAAALAVEGHEIACSQWQWSQVKDPD